MLLVLVNDPPAPPAEPTLFGGIAMTYYGRWTYKFEEAERRGAAGMLIVHRTDQAGYRLAGGGRARTRRSTGCSRATRSSPRRSAYAAGSPTARPLRC